MSVKVGSLSGMLAKSYLNCARAWKIAGIMRRGKILCMIEVRTKLCR